MTLPTDLYETTHPCSAVSLIPSLLENMLVASGVFCLRVCPASSSGLSPPTPPPPCRQTVENLGNARDLKGRLVAFRLDLLAAWRGQSEPSYTVAFVPAQQLQPGHANLRLMRRGSMLDASRHEIRRPCGSVLVSSGQTAAGSFDLRRTAFACTPNSAV